MASEIAIREITEADAANYHRCLDVVARERRFIAATQAPEFKKTEKWVHSVLAKGFPYFVAIAEGNVIGWCDVGPIEWEGFGHIGHLGMGIHPNFRRQKIGSRLLEAALTKARAMGLERLELEVFSSNIAAQSLYLRYGFINEGRKQKARKIDGVYDDILIMALML